MALASSPPTTRKGIPQSRVSTDASQDGMHYDSRASVSNDHFPASPTNAQESTPLLVDESRPSDHDHTSSSSGKRTLNHETVEHGHGHSHSEAGSMNMRALLLHVLGDALGNVGVIATGLIIWLTSWSFKYYFDPIISLVITVIIFSSALPLGMSFDRARCVSLTFL